MMSFINRPRIILLLGVLLVLAGFFLSMKPVFLTSAGRVMRVFTHASSVAVALRDAGVSVAPDDVIAPPLDSPVSWGMTIAVEPAHQIEISKAGSTRWVSIPASPSATAADVLSREGITLSAEEGLLLDGAPADVHAKLTMDAHRIEILPMVTILVADSGGEKSYTVLGPTVGDALWQAGLRLRAADATDPALSSAISALPGESKRISILRAIPATLRMDGEELTTYLAGKTVGEALALAGYALTGLDYSVPDEGTPLPADGNIRIVRVHEELLRDQTPIDFDTKTQPVADLEIDQKKIVQPGTPGIREKLTRVRYEDGREVSRTPEAEQVLVAPQSRISGYGTKIIPRTIVVEGETITYWRKLTLFSTAYSPCASGAGKCMTGTSGGKPAGKGIVAMVYSWWLLFGGQHLYIPGYGYGEVGDTGGGWPPGNHYWIDLGYDDGDPAIFAWSKWITVYFLVPAEVVPGYILP
jgi:resuscitation-promoting factor RpfB